MLVLAEERDQPPAERLKVGGRGGAALYECGRSFLTDPAGEDYLVDLLPHPLAQVREIRFVEQPRGQLEHSFHVRLRRSRPHYSGARLSAQQQVERVRQHRLAGAGLAGDGGETVAGPQLCPLDQEQVLYAQLEQHPAGVPAAPDGASWP